MGLEETGSWRAQTGSCAHETQGEEQLPHRKLSETYLGVSEGLPEGWAGSGPATVRGILAVARGDGLKGHALLEVPIALTIEADRLQDWVASGQTGREHSLHHQQD